MNPQLFGTEHILYIIISTIIGGISVFLIKKFAKSDKSKTIALRCFAGMLFVAILTNRLSQVFRYDQIRWYCIIPDSFCGMTSFVLAVAVLFGKKDNSLLHFSWLLGLFGGISTVIYATFVDQHSSFFYLPTISGLLHHSFCASLVILLLMFNWINITYKKWYCIILGFTCYLTVGAYLMAVHDMGDAFHIVEPLLSNTNLTAWVMAPMYLGAHGLIILIIEFIRYYKKRRSFN